MKLSHTWIVIVSLAGCQLTKSMTEAEFCQEYGKRECAKVADICAFPAASCEPVRQAACQQMAAASKTGTRTFNPDNADRCLKQVDATYVNFPVDAARLATLDRTCARVFSGTVKANEACTIDYDCQGDLICDKGRCGVARKVASGGGCANIGETCPAGEYCNTAGGIPTCAKRQAAGATCSDTQPCVEDLRCTGTCGARLAIGMTCTADDECQSLYCNPYPAAGSPRKCGPGLSFSDGSPSCAAFMGSGAPAADAGP